MRKVVLWDNQVLNGSLSGLKQEWLLFFSENSEVLIIQWHIRGMLASASLPGARLVSPRFSISAPRPLPHAGELSHADVSLKPFTFHFLLLTKLLPCCQSGKCK